MTMFQQSSLFFFSFLFFCLYIYIYIYQNSISIIMSDLQNKAIIFNNTLLSLKMHIF
ncbi:hypothetical protein ACMBCN_02820 [Candidatus Liberibacter asiaticus]